MCNVGKESIEDLAVVVTCSDPEVTYIALARTSPH